MEWRQKAASQGQVFAQIVLGDMYRRGTGVPKDLVKAAEWYQKAADQGDPDAQTMLGTMYASGAGVMKDAVRAVEWYRKAAAQGNLSAQSSLAISYLKGEGVPKDVAKALELFQISAAGGDARTQGMLSKSYFVGEVIPKDLVLAYAWANVAASRGDDPDFRDALEIGLSPAEKAEAQRISSNWRVGQVLVREGGGGSPSVSKNSSSTGSLSKKGNGTIFVVSKAGHAITNQHVTSGCTELRIQGRDGVAKLITEDAVNDLALVQIPAPPTDIATIASEPGKLRQGDDVVVFGFPLNSVLSSGGNLTPGVVSALTGLGNNTNQIQITAPIQPGSSGSPVLNKKGEVVGVVSMKLSDSKMMQSTGQIGQSVNFATSGQTIKSFLDVNIVKYRTVGSSTLRDKNTADLADEARKWTLLVECWR
jgi:S1-C subfamily serine protease